MRRILVAIDSSPYARKALTLASDMAMRFEAELLILHVTTDGALSRQELALLEAEYAGELIRRAEQAGLGALGADENWSVQMLARQGDTAALGRRLLGERLLARTRYLPPRARKAWMRSCWAAVDSGS